MAFIGIVRRPTGSDSARATQLGKRYDLGIKIEKVGLKFLTLCIQIFNYGLSGIGGIEN